jgi:hypothetical protein
MHTGKIATRIGQISLLLSVGFLPACFAQGPDQVILPEDFRLPTVNEFTESPGCYLAAYTREPGGEGIDVVGQVRVAGAYEGRICQPAGYEGRDISAEKVFRELFERHFPQVCSGGRCWAGGDTGGFVGIP